MRDMAEINAALAVGDIVVDTSEATSPASEWSIESCARRIWDLTQRVIANIDPRLQPLAAKAVETRFHPTDGEPLNLLNTESINEQIDYLKNIVHKGEVGYDFDKLLKNAFVLYTDGIDVRNVNNLAGRHPAEMYLVGNLESLLITAEKMNCDVIIGRYSGDESLTLLIPRSNEQIADPNWNADHITQMIHTTNHDYFYGDTTTARILQKELIDPIRNNKSIPESQSIADKLGLSVKIKRLDDIHPQNLYEIEEENQIENGHFRERQLMSLILDGVQQPETRQETDKSLADLVSLYITKTTELGQSRLDDEASIAYYESILPRSIKSIYDEVISQPDGSNLKSRALAYALQASFERTFSEGLVYKIDYLFDVIHDHLENKNLAFIIDRSAPYYLKNVNKEMSHHDGDELLIYAAEVFHELKKYLLHKLPQPTGNVPDHPIMAQHFGTLMGGTPIAADALKDYPHDQDGIIRIEGEEYFKFLDKYRISPNITRELVNGIGKVRLRGKLRLMRAKLYLAGIRFRDIATSTYGIDRENVADMEKIAQEVPEFIGGKELHLGIYCITAQTTREEFWRLVDSNIKPLQYAFEGALQGIPRSDIIAELHPDQATMKREAFADQRGINGRVVQTVGGAN